MNLEYEEKCHLTFQTDKGTAHLLTKLAHLKGMTQGQLLDQICKLYLMNSVKEIEEEIKNINNK